MRMSRLIGYTVLAALLWAVPAPFTDWNNAGAAGALPPQLSHRAVYRLSLVTERGSPSVDNVDGRMILEWRATCAGYITEQRIVTRTVTELGNVSISDVAASSWESLDGKRYRFHMRQRADNDLIDEYEGQAWAGGSGEPGRALLRKPEQRELLLPSGVLFPSGHMEALLNAAAKGQRHLTRQVFDGTSDSDYYHVVAHIGDARDDRPGNDTHIPEETLNLSWWPLQVSYYNVNEREGAPEFEMSFRLYGDGVSDQVTMDYGDFALLGQLEQVVPFAPPDC